MSRTYDPANIVVTHKFADDKVMQWSYDNRNVVTNVTYDGDTVLTKGTDPGYRCTSETFGNGLVRSINFGRQDNFRTNDRVLENGNVIDELNFDYTYAVDKNVTSETSSNGMFADLSFGVTYDPGNRVKTWNRVEDYLNARESQSWNYDAAGNWNSTTIDGDLQNRVNNASDELATIDGDGLNYDSRGNLLEDQDGQQDTWDIDNRIATIDPSTGADTITQNYDAFSRRVHREFGNTDEVLLWWGKEEYAEHESIGSQPTIQNDLQANPSGLNSTFGRALEGDKNDIQYFHKNYLDHVYSVSDDNGNIIEHYRYSAFGEPEVYNTAGTKIAGSGIDNDILWNVKRYDGASGLYMYLYRHYEAIHGRWPSIDPVNERGGNNLYGFVENSPLVYFDFLGAVGVEIIKMPEDDGVIGYRSLQLQITFTAPRDIVQIVSIDWEFVYSDGTSSRDQEIQIDHFPVKRGEPYVDSWRTPKADLESRISAGKDIEEVCFMQEKNTAVLRHTKSEELPELLHDSFIDNNNNHIILSNDQFLNLASSVFFKANQNDPHRERSYEITYTYRKNQRYQMSSASTTESWFAKGVDVDGTRAGVLRW